MKIDKQKPKSPKNKTGCNTIVISAASGYNPHMYELLHHRLNTWYQEHGRHDLPWRQTDDPYRIWVSEVMLQQTQVKTVLERFYFPFLERFATLQSLAAAPLDNVLKQWEGLGYYSRARHLHKAATMCTPYLPDTPAGLEALPGIGKSTAHAIAAFAYGTPVPILDANVKRILFRFFGRRNADDKTLWKLAYKLFDTRRPFVYNQAMMDVGATLCLPKKALCGSCPLHVECKAAPSDPLRYPQKQRRKKSPVRQRHIYIYTHNDMLGLCQREERFLGGLWGFLQREMPPNTSASRLGNIKQVYSHFSLEATVWLLHEQEAELTFFTKSEIAQLALSQVDHKALKLIDSHMC